MSTAEVVKKRGRPKKVVSDQIPAETPETVKKPAIRQKSTKATSEPPTTTTSKPKKAALSTKSSASEKSPTKVAAKPSSKTTSSSKPAPASTTRTASSPTPVVKNSPVTPANSTILNHVRELEANASSAATAATPKTPASPSRTAAPSTTYPETIPSIETSKTLLEPSSSSPEPPIPTMAQSKPATSPTTAGTAIPPTENTATSKPRIPLAEMNSKIVSDLSSRAGARPGSKAKQQLPPGYNAAARRVTMTMIALPIAIVTSYVLFQRRVEEKNQVVRPGLTKVDPGESTRSSEE